MYEWKDVEYPSGLNYKERDSFILDLKNRNDIEVRFKVVNSRYPDSRNRYQYRPVAPLFPFMADYNDGGFYV